MRSIFLLLFILGSKIFYGQDHRLNVTVAKNSNNKIQILWTPDTYEGLLHGFQVGYDITRYTVEEGGVPLNANDLASSKVDLAINLKPFSNSEWQDLLSQNIDGAAAAKNLFQAQTVKDSAANMTLKDLVEKKQEEEMILFSSVVLSLKNIRLAEALGFTLVDTSADINNKYLYKIKFSNVENDFAFSGSNALFDPSIITSAGQVSSLKAKGNNRFIMLSWDIGYLSEDYISFNVERSADSIHFIQINDEPLLLAKSENSSLQFYRDSIPQNGVKYYYRIRGNKLFGDVGPYSNIVSDKGIDKPLNFSFMQHPPQELPNSVVSLSWSFPNVSEDSIQGFNILRSFRMSDTSEILNADGFLPSDTRIFEDSAPNVSNYYTIEAVDVRGKKHQTSSLLLQLSDSIPPSIPTGFVGKAQKNNTIKLNWNQVNELDLLGYKVYMSNLVDGEYTEITTKISNDTSFDHHMTYKTLQKKIYFKIASLDFRKNMSELSQAIEIQIPDIIPPSSPSLVALKAEGGGIFIEWKESQSDDVVRHDIQRQEKGKGSWKTIYSIGREGALFIDQEHNNPNHILITDSTYLDVTYQEYEIYEYRILALDEGNNEGYSRVFEISPQRQLIKGRMDDEVIQIYDPIKHGSGLFTSKPDIPIQPPSPEEKLLRYIDDMNRVAYIGWNFNSRVKPTVFKIYRRVNDERWKLYKTIPANPLELFYVPDLSNTNSGNWSSNANVIAENTAESSYMYQKLYRRQYGFYDVYAPVQKRVSYKIIAEFAYGETSEFSKVLQKNVIKTFPKKKN